MSVETAEEKPQKPTISHAELHKLQSLVKLYSVHPQALITMSHSPNDRQHAHNALQSGQTEMLIVTLPHNRADLKFATELLHQMRGKEPPTSEKIDGLSQKGYMVVPEPSVIVSMKAGMRDAYCSTEKKTPSRAA